MFRRTQSDKRIDRAIALPSHLTSRCRPVCQSVMLSFSNLRQFTSTLHCAAGHTQCVMCSHSGEHRLSSECQRQVHVSTNGMCSCSECDTCVPCLKCLCRATTFPVVNRCAVSACSQNLICSHYLQLTAVASNLPRQIIARISHQYSDLSSSKTTVSAYLSFTLHVACCQLRAAAHSKAALRSSPTSSGRWQGAISRGGRKAVQTAPREGGAGAERNQQAKADV